MKVWIVLDNDYDNTWVVAVYSTESMASEHVALMGGYADEQNVRNVLHPDAVDPIKQKERADADEKWRLDNMLYRQRLEDNDQLVEAARPCPPHMMLCHCETFTSRTDPGGIQWTEHGYCRYCGGWSPTVFRDNMGEAALQAAIDELALHNREKMRQIVSA